MRSGGVLVSYVVVSAWGDGIKTKVVKPSILSCKIAVVRYVTKLNVRSLLKTSRLVSVGLGDWDWVVVRAKMRELK